VFGCLFITSIDVTRPAIPAGPILLADKPLSLSISKVCALHNKGQKGIKEENLFHIKLYLTLNIIQKYFKIDSKMNSGLSVKLVGFNERCQKKRDNMRKTLLKYFSLTRYNHDDRI